MESVQRDHRRVLILGASRSSEQSKRRVVAEPKIQGKAGTDAPRILNVQSNPFHVLRKRAIAGGNEFAAGGKIRSEGARVGNIERRLLGKLNQSLGIIGEPAAQNRFVNKICAELDRVFSASARHVVTKLILALIAPDRKCSDAGNELIVAERFKSRRSDRGRAKRKSQRQAKVRVSVFGMMKVAGLEDQIAQPLRIELKLIVDQEAVV